MKAMYFIKIETVNGVIDSAEITARKAIEFLPLFIKALTDGKTMPKGKSVSIYKVGEPLPQGVHLFKCDRR